MKHRRLSLIPFLCGAVAGCSDEADSPRDRTDGTTPAVLVGVFVQTPDARNIYIGAVPEVPEGELDYSDFVELGNVDVMTYGGWVFASDRDASTLTRFGVRDDYSLFQYEKKLSFLDYSSAGNFEGDEIAFISEHRAYMLPAELDVVVVFDPSTMQITGTIPMDPPDVPEGFSSFAHSPTVIGDRVVWQIVSTNDDAREIHHAVTLAVADANTDAPVRYISDERCAGANGGHLDERGDYYVRADAYWGKFAAYGEHADEVQTCILRLRSGGSEFDPDYSVSMESLTGSRISWPWFHVEGSQYIAWAWKPDQALPADEDEYWLTRGFQPLLVDLESGNSEPYPDLEGTIIVSSAERTLDGVAYYERSEVGYVGAENSAEIVELRPSGIVRKFAVPSIWAFGRIR
jgi:hypothetical protein